MRLTVERPGLAKDSLGRTWVKVAESRWKLTTRVIILRLGGAARG
jgi:hypothetical protein